MAGRRGTTVLDRSSAYPWFGWRAGRLAARLVRRGGVHVVHGMGAASLGYAAARERDWYETVPLLFNPHGMEEFGATGPGLRHIQVHGVRAAPRCCSPLRPRGRLRDRDRQRAGAEPPRPPASGAVARHGCSECRGPRSHRSAGRSTQGYGVTGADRRLTRRLSASWSRSFRGEQGISRPDRCAGKACQPHIARTITVRKILEAGPAWRRLTARTAGPRRGSCAPHRVGHSAGSSQRH